MNNIQDQTANVVTHLVASRTEILDMNQDLLLQVKKIHLHYTGSKKTINDLDLGPGFVKDGISFYSVGRNASLEFYLGVRGDEMYKAASFHDYDINPETGEPEEIYEFNYRKIDPNNLGYLGHF